MKKKVYNIPLKLLTIIKRRLSPKKKNGVTCIKLKSQGGDMGKLCLSLNSPVMVYDKNPPKKYSNYTFKDST